MHEFDLTGRRALVTGSSEGIGLAIARRLAAAGAEVHAHGLEAADTFDAKRALVSDRVHYHCVNLASENGVGSLIAAVGPLDILVSSVAVQIRQPIGAISDAAMEEQFALNFTSAVQLIQAVLPGMQERCWGRIVTIGSVQERRPHPQMIVYAALKAAQENMVRNVACQVARDGVTVNNVAPGVIETARNTAVLSDPAYATDVMARIPSRRFGQPDDVAGPVLMLCSEAGGYITGSTLPVDGGLSLS